MSNRIRLVDSFDALIAARFDGEVNALCWRRELRGDFGEIVSKLRAHESITAIDDDDLRELDLSAAGAIARKTLLADQALLRDHGLSPGLDLITEYPRDDEPGPVATDVYSFHVDRAPIEADTWLCTYHGASSEALPNEMAVRKIDVPEIRAELLRLYGGLDDVTFATFLSEGCFDLHYLPLAVAQPYAFGIGNMWRIATDWPGSPVLPCIHRAPPTRASDPPRLLLIS